MFGSSSRSAGNDTPGPRATATPSRQLLAPEDVFFMLVDHQPQMFFGVENISRAELRNNVTALAKTATIWDIPTILTTVAAETFSGHLVAEVQSVFPRQKPIDRSMINAWEDENVIAEVNRIGRRKLVIAGLWTEVCLMLPVLSAVEQGFEVYFVTDASGGVSTEVHERAVQRMTQAGAIPVTWMQVLLELQRDWSRKKTYDAVMKLLNEHGGAYGLGIEYVQNPPKSL